MALAVQVRLRENPRWAACWPGQSEPAAHPATTAAMTHYRRQSSAASQDMSSYVAVAGTAVSAADTTRSQSCYTLVQATKHICSHKRLIFNCLEMVARE